MAVEIYISEDQIKNKITELAYRINEDFSGQELVVICVLNGAFMFCADLLREITLPVTMEFIKASSYISGTQSSGEIKFEVDVKKNLAGKNVLIIEDIVDTGLTITKIMEKLKTHVPAKIKLASLLFKPSRNIHPVKIDYLGFEIQDKFVIGFGLDYDGRFRELPYIGIFDED
ncbi:MAG: hypoxanthine phosphoribosyltransferase [Bdellovibrio sp.]|nr:hypoxanthine phosphoribosyltransferase [Bdellovibrio sp.]